MPFPLRIPKQTDIRNPRLLGLYYFILFLVISGFAAFFFTWEQWARQVSVAGHVYANMWVTGLEDLDRFGAGWENVRTANKVCTSPQDYDYWWSTSMIHHYDNHTCPPLCRAGPAFGCLSALETFFQEDPARVFIVTQIQEAYMDGSTTIANLKPANMFVPSAESLGIGLQYRLSVPAPSTFSSSGSIGSAFTEGGQQLVTGSSGNDITTVIIDSKGKIWKILGPSRSIDLTVPQLLTLAGRDGALDTPQTAAGAGVNTKRGAFIRDGPIGRLLGMELTLEIDCYDGPQKGEKIQRRGGTQLVCYLAVQDNLQGWSSHTSIDLISRTGESRSRNYHGIRVKVGSGGYLKFVSVANILINITSALVLLSLPQRFVQHFATICLGQLSAIYRQAIYDVFDLKTEVTGIATRLMTSSAAFVQLEDVKVAQNGRAGISRRRMAERLQQVLRNRSETVDCHEVEQLVDYCFKSVASEKKTRSAFQLLVDEVSALFKKGQAAPMVTCPYIDIDAFSVACTSNERISFATFVDWFDADRTLTCFEKFFTPYNVKKHVLRSSKFRKTLPLEHQASGRSFTSKVSSSSKQGSEDAHLTSLFPEAPLADVIGNSNQRHDELICEMKSSQQEREPPEVAPCDLNFCTGDLVYGSESLEQERENGKKMRRTVAGILQFQTSMQDKINALLEEVNCRMQKADEKFMEMHKLIAENRGEERRIDEEIQSVKQSFLHWEGELKSTQALAGRSLNVSSQCHNFITGEFPQRMDQFRTEFESKLVKQEVAGDCIGHNGDDGVRRANVPASCANAFGRELESKQVKQEVACASVSHDDDGAQTANMAASCANAGLVSSQTSSGKLSRGSSTTDVTGLLACDNFPRVMAGLVRSFVTKDKALNAECTKATACAPNSERATKEPDSDWTRRCGMRSCDSCS